VSLGLPRFLLPGGRHFIASFGRSYVLYNMKYLCKFPSFDIYHMTVELFSSFVNKQKRAVYKLICLHGFTLELVQFHLV
jgi:hypothetical protein